MPENEWNENMLDFGPNEKLFSFPDPAADMHISAALFCVNSTPSIVSQEG